MPASSEGGRTSDVSAATFELERFAWGAPDRLELAGTFTGIADVPADTAVLVLHGDGETHRLPADPASVSGSTPDGHWQAAFAWLEAPVPFEAAELSIGDRVVVDLPQPGSETDASDRRLLEVRTPPAPETGDVSLLVKAQAELIVAQQEAHDLQVAADRIRQELARAQEDLESERALHGEDMERFRAGLLAVQKSAEDGLAAERRATEQREDQLREARDGVAARDAALAQLRRELDETAGLRAELDQARAELEDADGLRDELDRARAGLMEAAGVRAELEQARADLTEAAGLRAELDQALAGLEDAAEVRAELQRARVQLEEAAGVRADLRRALDEIEDLREVVAIAGQAVETTRADAENVLRGLTGARERLRKAG